MNQSHRLVLATALFVAVIAGAVVSQAIDLGTNPFNAPVSATGYVSLSNVPQGGTAQVALGVTTRSPWHINANLVTEDFLVPTEVHFFPPAGITVRGAVYPQGIEKKLGFSEKPLRLYEGTVYVGAMIDVAKDAPVDTLSIRAMVTYQACDNEKCLLPESLEVFIPVPVSTPEASVDLAHPDVFDAIDFTSLASGASTGGTPGGTATADDGGAGRGGSLQNAIASRGLWFGFVLVFLGGLALNLTPCVYPMIPITVSYFGGQSRGRSGHTLSLALLYLLGMATMYSALGLVAAFTGSLFGSALQNPIVLIVIAAVMVALAMSMFGYYEIRIPERLAGMAGTAKQGRTGSFLMGLTVGIVAAPCIGPFVLGLLTFVGESGSLFLGFSLFFVLALGLGLPFVVLAVASGNIARLPRSGEWMEWVRRLFGLVLLAMALYFLRHVIGDIAYYALLGALLVVGGVMLGFVSKVHSSTLWFAAFRRLIGVAAPLYGLYMALAPGHILGRQETGPSSWPPYAEVELTRAVAEKRPVVIDFSADWCLPCKELEHKTFSQDEVVAKTRNFVTLKADLTQHGSPDVRALRKRYDIKGVPTIVFIDASGKERADLRAVQFIDKDEFLRRLDDVDG
ncbi:MAG TPA: cytochrome c biogenesis protein CcdA [Candidatus Krumholzibacteria bacterium]